MENAADENVRGNERRRQKLLTGHAANKNVPDIVRLRWRKSQIRKMHTKNAVEILGMVHI